MTDPEDADAATRRARIAEAIAAHRRAGSESPVLFAADVRRDRPVVDYDDREIVVEVSGPERDRLEELMREFPVFKTAQPATRKAPEGVVHVSALADPKHASDFVDRLFLDVYEVGRGYQLVVEDT